MPTAVAQAYIDYSVEQKRKATEEAQRWNQQQMDRVQQQMVDQKAGNRCFPEKRKHADLPPWSTVTKPKSWGLSPIVWLTPPQRRIAAQSQYDEVQKALAKHSPENIISLPEFSGHAQIQDLRIAPDPNATKPCRTA
ncbi:Uncharacterised protein [Kluyvera cryocrescens]|uniref:Uncharacterized protein n=1 Tax=Kluyvera cryocrescens TaxID=580 RepID=A0A485D320_KLUCR|nr:Uncharacterised protein [Kluyvera cryocrescens]